MTENVAKIEEKIVKLLDEIDEAITDLVIEVNSPPTPDRRAMSQMVRNTGYLLHDNILDIVGALSKTE